MSNDDKLKVRQKVSKKKCFKELTLIRDFIFWIDSNLTLLLGDILRRIGITIGVQLLATPHGDVF